MRYPKEHERRLELWDRLQEEQKNENDGGLVRASTLRYLRIYNAGSGVDRAMTSGNLSDCALSVVHTGASYDDDWTDDGVLYHYPDTNRPGAYDDNEIDSLRRLLDSAMFLFAICHEKGKRRVKRGWVKKCIGHAVWIAFDEQDDSIQRMYDTPYEQTEGGPRKRVTRQVTQAVRDPRFAVNVYDHYGSRCIMTGIDVLDVLDAAHIQPVASDGKDHHENGLPLAAHVHRAFDANIIGIDPGTHRIVDKKGGRVLAQLGIDPDAIVKSEHKPHGDVLAWRWDRFSK